MAEGKANNIIKQVPIKDSEILGRRLGQNHIDMSSGRRKYLIDAFIDTRIETDLSVDLIGDVGNAKLTKNRVAEVTPIARKDFDDNGAESPFIGWAGIKRKTIKALCVKRTPVTPEEKPDNPNPHHCEIDRSGHRTRAAARSLAFELVAQAEQDDMFIAASPNT